MKLCECGCGLPAPISPVNHARLNYVKGQPMRFRRGHHGNTGGMLPIPNANGCLIWQRAKHPKGYGVLNIRKKITLAHRYYYEQARGPIPKGMTIDHLCCNKLCVNVAHMEVVTLRENHRRYLERSGLGKYRKGA